MNLDPALCSLPTAREGPLGEVAKPWPVVIFLHGQGERGTDGKRLDYHGPLKLRTSAKPPDNFPFYLVCPQCPPKMDWSHPTVTQALDQLLENLKKKPEVDRKRLYLCGWSMGAYGVVSWLQRQSGASFVAAVSVSGGTPPGTNPVAAASSLLKVPLWIAYGINDQRVKAPETEQLIANLKPNPSLKLEPPFDDPADSKPSAHVRACQRTFENPAVYQWLLTQGGKGSTL